MSFERADTDADGFVSFEELTAPRSPEEQCKQLYGEFAEFDGARSCRCVRGYTADVNGTCIQGSAEVCTSQFGPHAEFDGVNNCQCKNGTISNVNGTCVEGSDEACQSMYGELAHFEKVNSSCSCSTGSVPDTNGTCVTASNELCQEWFGPNTAFNGENSCVCKKGFVYADGECFRGSNKICGSIIAGSKFDGNNNCVCRRGYQVDSVRAMCVKNEKKPGKDGEAVDEVRPAPKQGTLSITLVEAKHLPKMDTHTKCDPFVVVTLGNQTKKGKVVKKTYNPTWEQSMTLSYSEAHDTPQTVMFEVYDWDKVSPKGEPGQFIGQVEFNLGDLMVDGVGGMTDLRARDGALVRGHDKNISAIYLEVRGLLPLWRCGHTRSTPSSSAPSRAHSAASQYLHAAFLPARTRTRPSSMPALWQPLTRVWGERFGARQISMTDQLPWVPPWQPILEEKPAWALLAVRVIAGVWTFLGLVLWCCLRPKAAQTSAAPEEKKEQ